MKNNREIGKKIAIAFSIVLTVFWLFPYIYVICCSFKPGAEVIAVPPRFFPTVLTVENFSGLFARMDVGGYLLNSLITAVCSTVIAVILLIAARRKAVLDRRELRLCDPIGDAGAVYAWDLILKRLKSCGVNTTAGSADALLHECLEQCSTLLTEEEIRSVIQNGTKLRYSPHGLREAERTAVIEGYRKLTEAIYRQADPLRRIWLKWFRHYV